MRDKDRFGPLSWVVNGIELSQNICKMALFNILLVDLGQRMFSIDVTSSAKVFVFKVIKFWKDIQITFFD